MGSHSKKLWQLLSNSERRDALALFGLMLLGMAFETLGVGLVIPALAVMIEGELLRRYVGAGGVLGWLASLTREQLVVAGMVGLVAVYALKAAFLSFLAWRQMRFVYHLQSQLSQRLFAGYLRQPYTFHIQRNSAQLIRNALSEVHNFTQYGVMQAITLLTELMVVVGILALLLYIQPLGALLAVATLLLAGWAFYYLTRQRMLRWGRERQWHEGMRLQHLQQGLGGVKDVQVLGREREFIARYRVHAEGFARIGRLQNTLQQLPRLALELLALIALAIIVIVMIAQGRPLQALLPTLGLFAAAAFRIMPAANRIITAVQITRHMLPVIDTLHEEIAALGSEEIRAPHEKFAFTRALTLEDVSFQYPLAETPALDKISLAIPAGTSIGFIGGSGAGKSTLVDVMLGLLTPQSGQVRVDGTDIRSNLRGWQDNIGYVTQSIYLTDDTLRRNIAFGIADADIDESAVQRALAAAQLDRFVAELPEGLDTAVGERGIRLSGGQLQRIGIARALYHDPPVLVLDEATSALDTATERDVMASVRALHGAKTVIIVAHRATTVEHCDWIFRLERGKIVDAGKPAHVLGASSNSLHVAR